MRKLTRSLTATVFVIMLLMLSAYSSTAQEIPKADNTVHDKLYYMIQKSSAVVLPGNVSEHITAINANNPNKAKAIYSQTRALKVMHNDALSKDDRRFFATHMLKSQSPAIIAIQGDIKKLLTNL